MMSVDEFDRNIVEQPPLKKTLSENKHLLSTPVIAPPVQPGRPLPRAPKIYVDADFDSDDEFDLPKKKLSETQSLAEFLRTTGPAEQGPRVMSPPPKKKKGLFGFGKKKSDKSEKRAKSVQGPLYDPQNIIQQSNNFLHNQQSKNVQQENNHNNIQQNISSQNIQFNNQQMFNQHQQPVGFTARGPSLTQNSKPYQQQQPQQQQKSQILQFTDSPSSIPTRQSEQQREYQKPPKLLNVIVPARIMSISAQPEHSNGHIYTGYNHDEDEYSEDDDEDDEYLSDDEYEEIEDQGFDDEMMRNTEFNAAVDHSIKYGSPPPATNIYKVIFAKDDEQIEYDPDEVLDDARRYLDNDGEFPGQEVDEIIDDEEEELAKVFGPRGSYYPTNPQLQFHSGNEESPFIKQRQSSLAYPKQADPSPSTNSKLGQFNLQLNEYSTSHQKSLLQQPQTGIDPTSSNSRSSSFAISSSLQPKQQQQHLKLISSQPPPPQHSYAPILNQLPTPPGGQNPTPIPHHMRQEPNGYSSGPKSSSQQDMRSVPRSMSPVTQDIRSAPRSMSPVTQRTNSSSPVIQKTSSDPPAALRKRTSDPPVMTRSGTPVIVRSTGSGDSSQPQGIPEGVFEVKNNSVNVGIVPVVVAKPKAKKKIRHVQMQTRGAQTKELSTQTEGSNDFNNVVEAAATKVNIEEMERTAQIQRDNDALIQLNTQLREDAENVGAEMNALVRDNEELKEEMEVNRGKFDKLSAQAYKKIKELLVERKMLDMEVSTLREQLNAFQDAQAREWGL